MSMWKCEYFFLVTSDTAKLATDLNAGYFLCFMVQTWSLIFIDFYNTYSDPTYLYITKHVIQHLKWHQRLYTTIKAETVEWHSESR